MIYSIVGKNKQGKSGTWDIEADSDVDLQKILIGRGMQAESINGEKVKQQRAKPLTSQGEVEDAI